MNRCDAVATLALGDNDRGCSKRCYDLGGTVFILSGCDRTSGDCGISSQGCCWFGWGVVIISGSSERSKAQGQHGEYSLHLVVK